jgi:hypothetical protein
VNIEDVYAFSYVPANDSARRQDGWLFDVRDEYARMGVPNERWTLSDVNVHYAVGAQRHHAYKRSFATHTPNI